MWLDTAAPPFGIPAPSGTAVPAWRQPLQQAGQSLTLDADALHLARMILSREGFDPECRGVGQGLQQFDALL